MLDKSRVFAIALFSVIALAQPTVAQYAQDCETLEGAPHGVVLTGQDSYYHDPFGTNYQDFFVYTYDGNALGVAPNPEGGVQFLGGTTGDGHGYADAMRTVSFGTGVWEVSFDFCGIFSGGGPVANSLGDFCTFWSDVPVHRNAYDWTDLDDPTTIGSTLHVHSPAGGDLGQLSPGPEWRCLASNHWYRCRTVFDYPRNIIAEVGIRDLSGGDEVVVHPVDWYLVGGQNWSWSPPEHIRFLSGGGGSGNTTAWDNVLVRELAPGPTGACCFSDGSCVLTEEPECWTMGGAYQGEGTSCDPNPCGPTQAERTSWGRIRAGFLR